VKVVLLATHPSSSFPYEIPLRNTKKSSRIGTCTHHMAMRFAPSYGSGRGFVAGKGYVDDIIDRDHSATMGTISENVAVDSAHWATCIYSWI